MAKPQYNMPAPKEISLADKANSQLIIPKATLVQRVTSSMKAAYEAFMGPGLPIPTVAPPGTLARQMNYPMNYNINIAPRSGYVGVGFQELVMMAQSYDLLRVVLERKKNQMVSMAWDIQPMDDDADADKMEKDIEQIKQFLKFPDKEHDWSTWLRAVLEQLYVIDAVSIEPIYDTQGNLFSLYGVDGATIQLKIDEQGRTPKDGSVAYQQVFSSGFGNAYGIQAVDFTTDQLVYKPWNYRFDRLFGFSIVEQIYTTVQIGLRRESTQLLAFTSGTIPEALMAVPDGWTPAQIREYQEYFDSRYMNNLARRAALTFVPHGSQAVPVKGDPLKNEFDEWLVRIMCWACGISPSGFVKDMNRATAETARTAELQDGSGSDKIYIKGLMDTLLAKCFKRPDLQFVWSGDDVNDPQEEMLVETGYIKVGVYSVDEVRAAKGLDPLGMGPAIYQTTGAPIFIKDLVSGVIPPPGSQPKTDDSANLEVNAGKIALSEAAKAKKKRFPVLPLIGRLSLEKRFAHEVGKLFRKHKESVISYVLDKVGPKLDEGKKADAEDNIPDQVSQDVNLDFFEAVPGVLEPIYKRATQSTVRQAYAQVGGDLESDLLNQADEAAISWASDHAAELVGRKWVDGELVDNPDAAYSIEDSTRNMLKSKIDQALKEGWSRDKLADSIAEGPFSASRATTIAQTELAYAHSAANTAGWKASGQVAGKRSLLSADHVEVDECDDNSDEGVIPLDEDFPSGDDAPPFHPNCKCSIVAVLKGEMPEEGE